MYDSKIAPGNQRRPIHLCIHDIRQCCILSGFLVAYRYFDVSITCRYYYRYLFPNAARTLLCICIYKLDPTAMLLYM